MIPIRFAIHLVSVGAASAFTPHSHVFAPSRKAGTGGVNRDPLPDFCAPIAHSSPKLVTYGQSPTALHASSFSLSQIGSLAATTFATSGVQKVLELSVISFVGASLRDRLDAKAITSLLLAALVPSIIFSSLSMLSLSTEMGYVFLSGLYLLVSMLLSGEVASRFVIKTGDMESDASETLRRTSSVQLGTMAPALSVFSFIREFVGGEYAALAALADVPTKVYMLLLIPYYLRFRGTPKEEGEQRAAEHVAKPSLLKRLSSALKDPFNLAITGGLGLAAIGRPCTTLGFFGKAVGSLAQAQTAVLFLLIGLKLKWGGGRVKLCSRLLLARHGFMSLATSAFLTAFLRTNEAAKLAAVLCSQAACSIIAFGQISKVAKEVDGYDTELAFDIVALSYTLTVILNTIACLVGKAYVAALPYIGVGLLVSSAALGISR